MLMNVDDLFDITNIANSVPQKFHQRNLTKFQSPTDTIMFNEFFIL